jgi:putative FmdB family regulatory protein
MPIYEFYCPDCNRIFNFLSRRIQTDRSPDCPKCGRRSLERKPSVFAVSKGRAEGSEDTGGPMPDLDESRMEQAMSALAGEAEGLDENDPRQAARLMRRMFDATGMPLGSAMEEAIRRMEAGEDPETIEEELGDALEADFDPMAEEKPPAGAATPRARRPRPTVDPELYEM